MGRNFAFQGLPRLPDTFSLPLPDSRWDTGRGGGYEHFFFPAGRGSSPLEADRSVGGSYARVFPLTLA